MFRTRCDKGFRPALVSDMRPSPALVCRDFREVSVSSLLMFDGRCCGQKAVSTKFSGDCGLRIQEDLQIR